VADRCDLSDLLVTECGCRIHAPTEPEPAGDPGPPFPARYPGHCSGCGDPIHDGDMIRHAGTPGAYIHEECTP
jgi:hypothetical protein